VLLLYKASKTYSLQKPVLRIHTPTVRPTGQWMFVVTISRRDSLEPSSSDRSIFGRLPQSVQNKYLPVM